MKIGMGKIEPLVATAVRTATVSRVPLNTQADQVRPTGEGSQWEC